MTRLSAALAALLLLTGSSVSANSQDSPLDISHYCAGDRGGVMFSSRTLAYFDSGQTRYMCLEADGQTFDPHLGTDQAAVGARYDIAGLNNDARSFHLWNAAGGCASVRLTVYEGTYADGAQQTWTRVNNGTSAVNMTGIDPSSARLLCV